jgi:hypothetical protein
VAVTLTAQQLIRDALLELGAIAPGETPTAAEFQDSFRRLNELVDSWGTLRLTMRTVARATCAIVADQTTYTIGDGGDFDVERPTFLDNATLLLASSTPATEIPLGAFTEQSWQAVSQKDLTNPQPTNYYYEPSMPLATLTPWPVPTDASNTLVIYFPEVVAQFADQSTEYTLAPGYARALRLNLSLDLALMFARPVPQTLQMSAADALGDIKRLNVRMTDLGMDAGLLPVSRPSYNINTDQG